MSKTLSVGILTFIDINKQFLIFFLKDDQCTRKTIFHQCMIHKYTEKNYCEKVKRLEITFC